MNLRLLGQPLRAAALLCSALLVSAAAFPQSAVISLDPGSRGLTATVPVKGEPAYANAPANFHAFASARVGEPAQIEGVKLRFAAATTLTSIRSTPDFVIEPGGSCKEGSSFAKGDTCLVLVRFTPQGAGSRLGKLTVAHTASAEPMDFGLGGYGYSPVVSFSPAVINTVAGTDPGGHGLLSGAQNLNVDGSDSVYIADTGYDVVRYIDSSGNITTQASGLSSPLGVASDIFGDIFITEPGANEILEVYNYQSHAGQISGTGTDSCTASAPCFLSAEAPVTPGQMAVDRDGIIFYSETRTTGGVAVYNPQTVQVYYVYDPFIFQESYYDAFGVDASDNIYSFWHAPTDPNCEIIQQSLYGAETGNNVYTKVVGTRACGFSGDGGQAGNAEISVQIGQIAFDVYGNLYFTDTLNQRVRRVEAVNGVITTIAGNGTAGYAGDGSQSNSAKLSYPTGVTVDSQGQVYIISGTGTVAGGAQVIRKLGPDGYLSFGNQAVGTSSSAHVITIANTGNSALTLNNHVLSGATPGDYSIDSATTSCAILPGSTLAAGQSCKVGIIFKPAAAGTANASLNFLDNTVTNTNTVLLNGVGTTADVVLSPHALTFPSTTQNEPVTVPVTVTNSGDAKLAITEITIGGANPGMFSYTADCGTSVDPKTNCTLHLTFNPKLIGSYTASVKINDNAPDSPQVITLTGTGKAPAIAVTPPVITGTRTQIQ